MYPGLPRQSKLFFINGGPMRSKFWLYAVAAAILLVPGSALAGDHDHGKHHDRDDDDRDHHSRYYGDHDRDEMRGWYRDHEDHLPPGLAKKDRLPPGLEKQLRVRGTLPPGLQKKMYPCPEELQRHLPPPPHECANVVIGGHIVLVNRSTHVVLDIVHFEQ
jgi:Ni/Co efflux regulator RcnB